MFKAAQGAVMAIAVVLLSMAFTVSWASEDAQRDNNQATTIGPTRAPIFREVPFNGPDVSTHRNAGKKADAALGPVQARLMKELRGIRKCESHKKGLIEVELEDDNIQEWNVKLNIPDGDLHDDLMKYKAEGGKDHIMLQLSFGDNYPLEPPFARVVYPNLVGLVHVGGSLCIDVLMGHGWDSSITMESFVLTLLTEFYEKKVRLSLLQLKDYYTKERAREHFDYMKDFHDKYGMDAT